MILPALVGSRCAFSENRALAIVMEVSLRSKLSGCTEGGDAVAVEHPT